MQPATTATSHSHQRQQPRIARFALGQTYITPGAQDALMAAGQTEIQFLRRHASGDWSELSTLDAKENERSVQNGFRIRSAYSTAAGASIWIITEADRSSTTILLSDQY